MALEETSRREFLQLARGGFLTAASLNFLPSSSDAVPRPRLGNYLVLDMEGKARNYKEPRAPVYRDHLEEILKNPRNYPSGIDNYLAWPGNPRTGRPALLAFGAHWCAPCGLGMPVLEDMYVWTKSRGTPIQVVGLNLIDPKTEQMEETIRRTKDKISKEEVTYPNLMVLDRFMWSMLAGIVSEKARLPQYVLVDMPSREVLYVTDTIYTTEGKDKLIEQIRKFLPMR